MRREKKDNRIRQKLLSLLLMVVLLFPVGNMTLLADGQERDYLQVENVEFDQREELSENGVTGGLTEQQEAVDIVESDYQVYLAGSPERDDTFSMSRATTYVGLHEVPVGTTVEGYPFSPFKSPAQRTINVDYTIGSKLSEPPENVLNALFDKDVADGLSGVLYKILSSDRTQE